MKSRLEFHPEEMSRRGEIITWVLAGFSLAILVFLRLIGAGTSPWPLVFVILMTLSAASMTLGNWMDSKTVLILKPEGLEFQNGLRGITFLWDEVQAAEVIPSRWGDLVRIFGEDSHFQFRTMREMIHKGEIRNRMGFAQGGFILEQILKNSDLVETNHSEDGRYYARP